MVVDTVAVRDVLPLIEALTDELAASGYADDEMFGYSAERLEQAGVHLFGARVDGVVVGIGGIEIATDGTAELKRFYVVPECRGTGVASAVITALLEYARDADVHLVRLETGVEQHAAIRFYAKHGFGHVDAFGPYVNSASSVCMARRSDH